MGFLLVGLLVSSHVDRVAHMWLNSLSLLCTRMCTLRTVVCTLLGPHIVQLWYVRMAMTVCLHAMRAGLTSEDADVPFLLEASQGDRISGKIARAEVASLVAAALASPAAAGAEPFWNLL